MAGITGLEPVTYWLTVSRSTIWAIFQYKASIIYFLTKSRRHLTFTIGYFIRVTVIKYQILLPILFECYCHSIKCLSFQAVIGLFRVLLVFSPTFQQSSRVQSELLLLLPQFPVGYLLWGAVRTCHKRRLWTSNK